MATLLITNLSAGVVNLGDFYTSLAVGASISVERSANDIPGLAALVKSLAAGDVSLSVTYSADEIASGLQTPDKAVEARDMAPAAAAGEGAAGAILIKKALPVGGGGADDVTIFAAGALPFKMRILDVWGKVSTGVAGSWLVRDEPVGAGTLAATVDSTAAGARIPTTAPNVSVTLTPGATKGLFVRRSDNTAIGEITILAVREV